MELTDLEDAIARNPYGLVAGAIGIGFVLGGGLFTRLTARIVGVGLRIGLTAALPVLTDGLLRAANQPVMDARAKANEGK